MEKLLIYQYQFFLPVTNIARCKCDLCGKQLGSSYELKLHVIGIVKADI